MTLQFPNEREFMFFTDYGFYTVTARTEKAALRKLRDDFAKCNMVLAEGIREFKGKEFLNGTTEGQ